MKYLQEIISPIEKNDKKFRVSLPQLLRDEPISDADIFGDVELEFAKRWVESIIGEDLPIRSAEQNELRKKKKISELRTRE